MFAHKRKSYGAVYFRAAATTGIMHAGMGSQCHAALYVCKAVRTCVAHFLSQTCPTALICGHPAKHKNMVRSSIGPSYFRSSQSSPTVLTLKPSPKRSTQSCRVSVN